MATWKIFVCTLQAIFFRREICAGSLQTVIGGRKFSESSVRGSLRTGRRGDYVASDGICDGANLLCSLQPKILQAPHLPGSLRTKICAGAETVCTLQGKICARANPLRSLQPQIFRGANPLRSLQPQIFHGANPARSLRSKIFPGARYSCIDSIRLKRELAISIPEIFWTTLLDKIGEGRVIPVIGPSLIEVTLDGATASLEEHLARRLAEQLELPPAGDAAAEPTLFEVVARAHRLDRDGDYHGVVHRLLRDLSRQLRPSPELVSLAQIANFHLYLTLGFDDLLLRALDEESRLSSKEACHLAYVPNQARAADLPLPLADLREPRVYALFGKSCAAPEFAISEEDLVEWVTTLQDPDHRPPLLFDALRGNHLLFIGCRLPDWLLRFFIRMARGKSFSSSRANETLIGLHAGEHAQLVSFLDRFSPKTQVLDATPQAFVAELAARWQARRAMAPTTGAGAALPLPPDIRPGGVFLSYSSGDGDAAKTLHEALVARQVDTWFDARRLGVGSLFDDAIGRNIGRCGVFLPMISAGILDRLRQWREQDGGRAEKKPFFLQEWELALVRRKLQPEAMAILPVRIDPLDLRDELIPEGLRELSWAYAPSGVASPELLDAVRQAVREARRQRQEVA